MKKDGKCRLFHFFKINIITGSGFTFFVVWGRKRRLLLVHLILHTLLHIIKLPFNLFAGSEYRNKKACYKAIKKVNQKNIYNKFPRHQNIEVKILRDLRSSKVVKGFNIYLRYEILILSVYSYAEFIRSLDFLKSTSPTKNIFYGLFCASYRRN